jgi:hypothetical protein
MTRKGEIFVKRSLTRDVLKKVATRRLRKQEVEGKSKKTDNHQLFNPKFG